MSIFALWVCMTSTNASCTYITDLRSQAECTTAFNQLKAKVPTARILVPCYAASVLPDYVLAR